MTDQIRAGFSRGAVLGLVLLAIALIGTALYIANERDQIGYATSTLEKAKSR